MFYSTFFWFWFAGWIIATALLLFDQQYKGLTAREIAKNCVYCVLTGLCSWPLAVITVFKWFE